MPGNEHEEDSQEREEMMGEDIGINSFEELRRSHRSIEDIEKEIAERIAHEVSICLTSHLFERMMVNKLFNTILKPKIISYLRDYWKARMDGEPAGEPTSEK